MKKFSRFKTWSKNVVTIYEWRDGTTGLTSTKDKRHVYCKNLNYDTLELTELCNKQNNPNFTSKLWVPSAQTEAKQDKYTDPADGVVILLSRRMNRDIDKSDHVGSHRMGTSTRTCMSNFLYRSIRPTQVPHRVTGFGHVVRITIVQLYTQSLKTTVWLCVEV